MECEYVSEGFAFEAVDKILVPGLVAGVNYSVDVYASDAGRAVIIISDDVGIRFSAVIFGGCEDAVGEVVSNDNAGRAFGLGLGDIGYLAEFSQKEFLLFYRPRLLA